MDNKDKNANLSQEEKGELKNNIERILETGKAMENYLDNANCTIKGFFNNTVELVEKGLNVTEDISLSKLIREAALPVLVVQVKRDAEFYILPYTLKEHTNVITHELMRKAFINAIQEEHEGAVSYVLIAEGYALAADPDTTTKAEIKESLEKYKSVKEHPDARESVVYEFGVFNTDIKETRVALSPELPFQSFDVPTDTRGTGVPVEMEFSKRL